MAHTPNAAARYNTKVIPPREMKVNKQIWAALEGDNVPQLLLHGAEVRLNLCLDFLDRSLQPAAFFGLLQALCAGVTLDHVPAHKTNGA